MVRNQIPDLKQVTGKVLIVDDEKKNQDVLKDILESEGHETKIAENGKQALKFVKEFNPNLILLDIIMPGMNGFEVCEILKNDSDTVNIPIIIVTSLDSPQDQLKGIDAGANDFLTNPISLQNVILRSRNFIYSHKLYNRVLNNYKKLEELEKLRDNLTHMIVHDMNSPLTILKADLYHANNLVKNKKYKELQTILDEIEINTNRLINMSQSMLDVHKFESKTMKLNKCNSDLIKIINESIKSIEKIKKKHKIEFYRKEEQLILPVDPSIIRRVVDNLLNNAIKFTPSGGEIKISIEKFNGKIKVYVRDNGPGIPKKDQDRIFKKFEQAKIRSEKKRYSAGLGLAFCKLAIEAHGGKIGVESEEGRGSKFWFSLAMENNQNKTCN